LTLKDSGDGGVVGILKLDKSLHQRIMVFLHERGVAAMGVVLVNVCLVQKKPIPPQGFIIA
jgi:hypothetical protein